MTAQQAFAAGMIPMGHFVQVDPMGRVVRIVSFVTSWAADTYQATRDGLSRVYA